VADEKDIDFSNYDYSDADSPQAYEHDEEQIIDYDTNASQNYVGDQAVLNGNAYNGVTIDDDNGAVVLSSAHQVTLNATKGLEVIRLSDGKVLIFLDSTTGDATFAGTLSGAAGTFSGTVDADSLLITPKSGLLGDLSFDAAQLQYVVRIYNSADGALTLESKDKLNNYITKPLRHVTINSLITTLFGAIEIGSVASGATTDKLTIFNTGDAFILQSGDTNDIFNAGNVVWRSQDGQNLGKMHFLGTSYADLKGIISIYDDTGTANDMITLNASGANYLIFNGEIRPDTDNTRNLGNATTRFKQLYAGTTTINTSDEREKQQIGAIPDEWLDAWSEVEFVRYKFNDAVAEKGEPNARWHIGVIAQRIEQAFINHGLDAFTIGLLGFDEWIDENGETQNRYSIRPDECQFMEMALMRRELKKITG
jgi:hypothetical protein